MIFYSFFTERWLAATDELTMVEECCYLRLVNWQYRNESPLPLELDQCYRIARATNAVEKSGVVKTLRTFYLQTPEGWVQQKVTHEVARFQAGEPARKARRESNREAKERSRNLQQRLYMLCRENGIATRKGMRLVDLRDALIAAGVSVDKSLLAVDNTQGDGGNPTLVVSKDVSGGVSKADLAKVSNVQNPRPITHSVCNTHTADIADRNASERVETRLEGGPVASIPVSANAPPERIADAVRALRSGGLQGINAGHPTLHALVAAGAGPDAFTFAAAHAVGKGKGFAYALAIVEGQMRDAAQAQANGLATPSRPPNVVEQLAPSIAASRNGPWPWEALEVKP